MIITLIIFTLANILLAFIDSRIISKGNKILHGINGMVYLVGIGVAFYLFRNWFLVAALLFNRLLVFNICLSLFRGLKWNYTSPAPASIIDRVAKSVFGRNGTIMYYVYLTLFIVSLILTFGL